MNGDEPAGDATPPLPIDGAVLIDCVLFCFFFCSCFASFFVGFGLGLDGRWHDVAQRHVSSDYCR